MPSAEPDLDEQADVVNFVVPDDMVNFEIANLDATDEREQIHAGDTDADYAISELMKLGWSDVHDEGVADETNFVIDDLTGPDESFLAP